MRNQLVLDRCIEKGCVYSLSPKTFEKNLRELNHLFSRIYKNTLVAYSYKTNYATSLLEIVEKLSMGHEIVSEMELNISKKIKASQNMIYFNGPIKTHASIKSVILNKGFINIDSMEDVKLIEQICSENNFIANVGIRLNFSIDDMPSRFGIDTNSDTLSIIISKLISNEKINFCGLHCHYAGRSLSHWETITNKMIKFIQSLDKQIISGLEYVSLGGGFYGPMPNSLFTQLSSGKMPSYKDYASLIATQFKELTKKYENFNPKLIIEPGTAVVANSMKFYAAVRSVKKVNNKYIYTVDGSLFNLFGSINKPVDLPLSAIRNNTELKKNKDLNSIISGYTCIENDIISSNNKYELQVNDIIEVDCVGSYSIVMKPPFIRQMPEIVSEDNHDDLTFIKMEETVEDVLSSFAK